MALLERQIVLKRKGKDGNTYMEFPVTKAECVDGAVLTVNNVAPDDNGNISITSVNSATKATQDGSGNTITSTYATKTELSGKADSSHTHTIANVTNLQTSLDAKANTADLATVATSGAYSDLSGTPTTLKNPKSLTLQNSAGTSLGAYDGSSAKTIKLTASTVGLGNVTNESKATMFSSAALTGTPTAPTATAGTNTTQIATTAFVTTAIANKTSVASATKATQDGSGNTITSTYATKTELTNGLAGKSDSDHTHGAATSSALGMVKVGSNISVSSGTISLTKANVTAALGYTPPTTDTVYTHPSTHAASMITGLATVATSGKYSDLSGVPTSLPANGGNADTVGGFTVGVNVPANAKFTDTVYTLPTAGSTLGGVKTTSTVTSTSGLTACPIIGGVPYYKDTVASSYTLGSFGVTATAAELNYCDGVTSNIQTQLNGKLSTSGTAAKATADASGNNIVNTYATKVALNAKMNGSIHTVSERTRGSSEPTYGLS